MNYTSICRLGVLMCKTDLKLTTDPNGNAVSTLWSSYRNCQQRKSAAIIVSILGRGSLYYCLKTISLNRRGLYSGPTSLTRKLPDLHTSVGNPFLLPLLASRSLMQPSQVSSKSHIFIWYMSHEQQHRSEGFSQQRSHFFLSNPCTPCCPLSPC